MSADRDSLFGVRSSSEVARRAMRGGALSIASQAVRGVVDGAATLVLARTLVPAEFGLIDMIVSATGIVDLFKDFGLSSATIQKDRIEHAQVSLLFWINSSIGFALTLVIAALAPLIAFVYKRPELVDLTLVLSLSTFLGALSVQHHALLRRNLRFGSLATIDTSSSLLASGCAVFAALYGIGAWALVARQIVRLSTQLVLTWALCGWRPSRPERARVRELLRFGSDVSTFQLLNYLERNLDNILIGRFAGPEALGFYAKAYGLMRTPIDQLNSFSNVAIPALSRMLADPQRYLQAYRSVSAICLLFTIPLAPLSIYSADWFVPALLGEQWRGTVPVFQWLAFTLLVRPIMNTGGWLFFSQGRTREMRRWSVIATAIATAAFAVGLPWGATGVAMSFALAEVFLRAPICLFILGSSGPVRVRDIVAAASPALCCALVIALACPLLTLLLERVPATLRTALSLGCSLALAAVVLVATPWTRSMLQDGRAMLALMRTQEPDAKR